MRTESYMLSWNYDPYSNSDRNRNRIDKLPTKAINAQPLPPKVVTHFIEPGNLLKLGAIGVVLSILTFIGLSILKQKTSRKDPQSPTFPPAPPSSPASSKTIDRVSSTVFTEDTDQGVLVTQEEKPTSNNTFRTSL